MKNEIFYFSTTCYISRLELDTLAVALKVDLDKIP